MKRQRQEPSKLLADGTGKIAIALSNPPTKPSFVQHPEFYLLRSPRRFYRYNTTKPAIIDTIIRGAVAAEWGQDLLAIQNG
jgi:hypothetical protein